MARNGIDHTSPPQTANGDGDGGARHQSAQRTSHRSHTPVPLLPPVPVSIDITHSSDRELHPHSFVDPILEQPTETLPPVLARFPNQIHQNRRSSRSLWDSAHQHSESHVPGRLGPGRWGFQDNENPCHCHMCTGQPGMNQNSHSKHHGERYSPAAPDTHHIEASDAEGSYSGHSDYLGSEDLEQLRPVQADSSSHSENLSSDSSELLTDISPTLYAGLEVRGWRPRRKNNDLFLGSDNDTSGNKNLSWTSSVTRSSTEYAETPSSRSSRRSNPTPSPGTDHGPYKDRLPLFLSHNHNLAVYLKYMRLRMALMRCWAMVEKNPTNTIAVAQHICIPLARELEFAPLEGRCWYWIGRGEAERQDWTAARRAFEMSLYLGVQWCSVQPVGMGKDAPYWLECVIRNQKRVAKGKIGTLVLETKQEPTSLKAMEKIIGDQAPGLMSPEWLAAEFDEVVKRHADSEKPRGARNRSRSRSGDKRGFLRPQGPPPPIPTPEIISQIWEEVSGPSETSIDSEISDVDTDDLRLELSEFGRLPRQVRYSHFGGEIKEEPRPLDGLLHANLSQNLSPSPLIVPSEARRYGENVGSQPGRPRPRASGSSNVSGSASGSPLSSSGGDLHSDDFNIPRGALRPARSPSLDAMSRQERGGISDLAESGVDANGGKEKSPRNRGRASPKSDSEEKNPETTKPTSQIVTNEPFSSEDKLMSDRREYETTEQELTNDGELDSEDERLFENELISGDELVSDKDLDSDDKVQGHAPSAGGHTSHSSRISLPKETIQLQDFVEILHVQQIRQLVDLYKSSVGGFKKEHLEKYRITEMMMNKQGWTDPAQGRRMGKFTDMDYQFCIDHLEDANWIAEGIAKDTEGGSWPGIIQRALARPRPSSTGQRPLGVRRHQTWMGPRGTRERNAEAPEPQGSVDGKHHGPLRRTMTRLAAPFTRSRTNASTERPSDMARLRKRAGTMAAIGQPPRTNTHGSGSLSSGSNSDTPDTPVGPTYQWLPDRLSNLRRPPTTRHAP